MRIPATAAILLAAATAMVLMAARGVTDVHGEAGTRRQPKHIRLDAARIATLEEVQELIEPVWWTANIYDGPEAYEESLAPFTRAQRLINAIEWYRAEVNNGGHYQFYFNSTGIVWRDALAGFEMLGLTDLAENLRESADLLGGDPPLDRHARVALLERLEPDFADITMRFWDLEDWHNVDAVILDYARAHPEEFVFDGVVHIPASQPTAGYGRLILWPFP